jgi:hypothetical protein
MAFAKYSKSIEDIRKEIPLPVMTGCTKLITTCSLSGGSKKQFLNCTPLEWYGKLCK